MRPNEEMSELEVLEGEIASLKSKIKNTEYDLMNSFKGNNFIQQKLVNSKKSLDEKEKRFEELNKLLQNNKGFKEFEDNVSNVAISDSQKKELIDDIKEELI